MSYLRAIRGVALTIALFLSGHCLAEGAPTALKLAPCALPDIADPARCGVIEVPEDPDRPDGRKLPIHVAVLPALSGKAQPSPIAVLMGGPGEEAIGAAADYARQFAALRQDRDLLFVDQRGAGQSAPLHCDLFDPSDAATSLHDLFPPAVVSACEAHLARSADLTRYDYPYFAHDLEAVRLALGYGKLDLFAGSYGTRAAQVYLHAYPDSVRTAYLGSVVPLDIETPLIFARTAETALDRLFEDCTADSACHQAYPQLSAEVAQLFERLDAGNALATVPGRSELVTLGRGRVAEWIRAKLYRPKSSTDLPWLLHRAFTGDWQPVADAILANAQGADHALSFGLFFAITCNEDIPFIDEPAVAAASAGTFLGEYRLRQQQVACTSWPRSTLPAGYRRPVASTVPTLFVTGDRDSATPLDFTNRVAPGFADHAILVAHGQGHTDWSDCIAARYAQFLQRGTARGLDTKCPATPRPPFKI
jgi:pimeloyl-ACP methyl ester carboxylesterase